MHAEDKIIIRNILYVVKSCCESSAEIESWAVHVNEKTYAISVFFQEGVELSIPLQDLKTIENVNPLRVANITFIRPPHNPALLKITVTNRNQPLNLTETEIIRVRKKRSVVDFLRN